MTRTPDILVEAESNDDSSLDPSRSPARRDIQGAKLTPFVSLAEFDIQHHGLLERQGIAEDESQLIAESQHFIERGRLLGVMLESPRLRQDCQSILNYWAIFLYRVAQINVQADLLPFDPALAPTLDDNQFPYRFEEEVADQAQQMLGWRRLLDECERDLASDHLLAILGDRDSGSRTLVHNLLLPILRDGRARLEALASSDQWRYYTVALSDEPVRDLVRAIASQDGHDAEWVTRRAADFRRRETALADMLEEKSEGPALLVFDHFEVLLKVSADAFTAVANNLAHLLQDAQQRYYVVAVLPRDRDFPLSKFGPLEKRLTDGHVLIAFTTAELRHLIEEPARRVGLIFESGLVDQILIDVQGEPEALLLLRFTLARLWKRRERNRITWQAYRQTGASRTALRIAMEEVYQELDDKQRAVLRRILQAMVSLESGGSFTASDLSREELDRVGGDQSQVETIIGKLEREGLFHQREEDGRAIVVMACKTLLTSWPPLITWLDELRVKQRFRLRLKQAAALWQERGRPIDLLWHGATLVEANEEFADESSLTAAEQNFLHASRNREKIRQRKRQAVIFSVVAFLGIIAIGAMIAERNAEIAEQKAKIGERMLGDAVEHISKGDLPAALLWLAERDATTGGSSKDTPDAEREARIRELAGLQLPQIRSLAFASETAPHTDDATFENVAVSPDRKHLAVIHRQRNGNENVYRVQIHALDGRQLESDPLSQPGLRGGRKSTGAVAFASLPLGEDQADHPFLLVAADRLYAWKVEDGNEWRKMEIRELGPEGNPVRAPAGGLLEAPLISIVAGGNGLLLTLQHEDNKRRLRLWRLAAQTGADRIDLHPVPAPEGMSEQDVQVACLSNPTTAAGGIMAQTHLVAICGTEPASELKVWTKPSEMDPWASVPSPEWVGKLKSTDPQRLHDWQWQPTNEGWRRSYSSIRAASFSPSGNHFVTACDDGQTLVWSLSQAGAASQWYVAPQLETELRQGSSIFDVAFPTNDLIITGGRDRTVRFWDIHARAEVVPRIYHEGTVNRIAYGGAGTLVTNTNRILRIWESVELKSAVIKNSAVQSAQISYDGERLFTASVGNPMSMDIRTRAAVNEPLYRLKVPENVRDVPLAAFSRSGDLLVVATKEARAEKTEDEWEWEPGLFMWDGFSSGDADSTLEYKTLRISGLPSKLVPAPNGKTEPVLKINSIALGRFGGQDLLAVVGQEDSGSSKPSGPAIFLGIDMGPQNQKQREFTFFRLVDAHDDQDTVPYEALCVAFSEEGDLLAIGDSRDRAKVWNVEQLIEKARRDSGESRSVIAADPIQLKHSSDVVALCFSPVPTGDAKTTLATVSSEGEASLWSLEANAGSEKAGEERTPTYKLQHDAKILTVSFSPDGRWIITGGEDRTARIWHAVEGRVAGILRHAGAVEHARLLENNRILTISRSSGVKGADLPPWLETRQWSISAAPAIERSELERIAARKVNETLRLETLGVDDLRLPADKPKLAGGVDP